jgi:chemotaxis family two-component system sensor kinase Cph1
MESGNTPGAITGSIDLCAKEPIHVPGFIQPFGHLIVVDADRRIVALNRRLVVAAGYPAVDLLGTDVARAFPALAPVDLTIDTSTLREIDLLGAPVHFRSFPIEGGLRGLEFLSPAPDLSINQHRLMNTRLAAIARTSSVAAWADAVVETVQQLLGYDRVMLYRFDPDFNGAVTEEVIAPPLRGKLVPYKGLHYPVGDIPPQARTLYKKKLSRLIPDVRYAPDPLVSGGAVVDLTYANLRSVSPIHLEYLGNMGVRATFVLSILIHGELWGLVACHHMAPKEIGLPEQNLAETITVLASTVLQSLLDSESAGREKVAELRARKIFARPAETPLEVVFTESGDLLREIVGADAVVVKIGSDQNYVLGEAPPVEDLGALVAWLETREFPNDVLVTHVLGKELPRLWAARKLASGLMALRLPASARGSSYVLWFRREVRQTISWGGNPNEQLRFDQTTGRLSPRASFARWQEITEGQSIAWTPEDIVSARIFRGVFLDFLATQAAIKKRQAEDLYLQSQRVVDLGRMAATAAHDFNNILQGIVAVLDLHAAAVPSALLERVETFADRGRAIIRSLLSYARTRQEDYEPIGAGALLEDVATLAQVLLPKNIKLAKDVDLDPRDFIRGAKQEIFQTLINLITNAKDAIGGRPGLVTVRGRSDRDRIVFGIDDDGPGISAANLGKIFDPFYTTKAEQKGTGLGLSYIKQIVESHGGTIRVTSTEGTGTTFELFFPRVAPAPGPSVSAATTDDDAGAPLADLRVLYVEDDRDLREITELVFAHIFAAVSAYPEAAAALGAFRAAPETFDLIICDLRMPGMDGIEFYRHIRETDRSIPFALMSGELDLARFIEELPQKESIILLPKPCRQAELEERILEKLGRGPQAGTSSPPQERPLPSGTGEEHVDH